MRLDLILPKIVDPTSGEIILDGELSLEPGLPGPDKLADLVEKLEAIKAVSGTLREAAAAIREAIAYWFPTGTTAGPYSISVSPRINGAVAGRLLQSRWAGAVSARYTVSYRLSVPVYRAALSNEQTGPEMLDLLSGCTWDIEVRKVSEAEPEVEDETA